MDKFRILAINPGSTSAKLAVYENEECIFAESASFGTEELEKYQEDLEAQLKFRLQGIEAALKKANIDPASFHVVVGRATGLKRVKAGAYEVTPAMIEYLSANPLPWHAATFGPLLAKHFADQSGCRAYTYDVTSADEMIDIARITGFKGVYRQGSGHVLNARACAIQYAKQVGKPLESLRLIVAHLGGGSTFLAFEGGRMVDNCGDLEGTYSPERCGPLSVTQAINYFVDNGLSKKEMMSVCRGKGGFVALLGTNSTIEVEKMIDEGDEKARLVFEGMCYRIAKSIGGLAAAPLKGKVDAVILTGGIAHSKRAMDFVVDYIKPLAGEIVIYPGEKEMEALALGGLRVLRGEEVSRVFSKEEAEEVFSI